MAKHLRLMQKDLHKNDRNSRANRTSQETIGNYMSASWIKDPEISNLLKKNRVYT